MNHDGPTFEQLCHAVLEGSADESDLELFRERLHSSAADREAYHQQVLIHALLIWQNGRAGVPESLVLAPIDHSAPANLIPFGKSFPFRRTMLAAAAGVTGRPFSLSSGMRLAAIGSTLLRGLLLHRGRVHHLAGPGGLRPSE